VARILTDPLPILHRTIPSRRHPRTPALTKEDSTAMLRHPSLHARRHGPRRGHLLVAATAVAGIALVLAGCSSGSGGSADADVAAAGSGTLSSVCPSQVVVQTSWYPQAENGFLFHLIKDDYKIDTAHKSVSGPLKVHGKSTGVTLQVRAGGPAIGYQQPITQMYTDQSITLAVVTEDQALQQSAKFASLSVFSPLKKSPSIVMWDPATYPDVKTIRQLGKAMKSTGGVVLYSTGQPFMDYLFATGQLSKSVSDSSYDGTPATFIAAGGKDATQAYSTNEAYTYPHVISQWKKPVAFQLVADAGWDAYPDDLVIRAGDKSKLTPCLKKLVPIFQQANVDYFAKPAGASKVILDQVAAFKSGDTYTQGTINAAIKSMLSEKLVGNENGTTGGFDMARVAAFFKVAKPVFTAEGKSPAAGATPKSLFTNEFLNTSIKF
jgi:hypothetical protein